MLEANKKDLQTFLRNKPKGKIVETDTQAVTPEIVEKNPLEKADNTLAQIASIAGSVSHVLELPFIQKLIEGGAKRKEERLDIQHQNPQILHSETLEKARKKEEEFKEATKTQEDNAMPNIKGIYAHYRGLFLKKIEKNPNMTAKELIEEIDELVAPFVR